MLCQLQVLLDQKAAEGIPLHLNKHLKSITQPMAADSSNAADAAVATGPAVLQFEDGSSFEADLVVGCDGLRSATRQALFGAQVRVHSLCAMAHALAKHDARLYQLLVSWPHPAHCTCMCQVALVFLQHL